MGEEKNDPNVGQRGKSSFRKSLTYLVGDGKSTQGGGRTLLRDRMQCFG